jgi:inorganic pyrophosphatase
MRPRVTVLIINKGKVLLLYRFKDGKEYYAVPGGGIEPGETEETAAVREIKEETGLDITLGEKIGTLELDGETQHLYLTKSFRGEPKLGSPERERQSPENVYRLEWIPLEKLSSINLREEIKDILFKHLSPLSHFLGKLVTVKIDRPLGSKHPKWGFAYLVNYGYIPDTKSADGEEIDAYVLGVKEPLKEFTGKCIAVIHRTDDDDDKLVIALEGTDFSDDEIRAMTNFQEKYFNSVINSL